MQMVWHIQEKKKVRVVGTQWRVGSGMIWGWGFGLGLDIKGFTGHCNKFKFCSRWGRKQWKGFKWDSNIMT